MREVNLQWSKSTFDQTPVAKIFEIAKNINFLSYAARESTHIDLIVQCDFQRGKVPDDLNNVLPGMSLVKIISAPSTGYEKETVLRLRFNSNANPAIAVQLQVPSVSLLPASGLDGNGIIYSVRGPPKAVKPVLDLLRMLKPPTWVTAKALGTETALSDGVVSPEQVRVIQGAQNYGWYERPRKLTMAELAKKLNLSRSTVSEHLARVESALVGILLDSASISAVVSQRHILPVDRAFDLIHPNDKTLVHNKIKESESKGEAYVITARFSRPDGTYFLARLNGIPEYNQDGIHSRTVGTFEDLTGHKEMEKVLSLSLKIANLESNSEKEYKTGSWDWNIMNGEVIWSNSLFEIYGCTEEGFIPSLDSFVNLLHPDERDYIHNYLGEAISTLPPLDFSHKIIRPDNGETRIMRCIGGIMTDENGVPNRVVGMATDITDQIEAEEAFQDSISTVNEVLIGNYIIDEKKQEISVDKALMNILNL